jgi:branched-chain amino acid aminotransferase
MIPARGKVTGAYANSTLAKSDAMLAGFDDALILSEDGHISEASGANVFIVRKGVAITPPIYSNVLEGITRRSVIQWMQDDLNIEVQERDIDRTEVYLAEEIFLCGTGAQIAPVSRIDHRVIGTGKIGSITRRVRDHYYQVVTGRSEKYRSWVEPVYVTEPAGVR